MSAVATTYLLTSKPENLIATSPKSKDCPQIQPLLHPLNPGPREPWLYLHGWMPIFRSIWRFKSLSRICSTRWYFPLLDWRRFYRSDLFLKLFYSRSLPLSKGKTGSPFCQNPKRIWQETGIYSTIGLSNANPLLAKLALDNEAKHCRNMRSNWSYEDVESKVWKLPQLTDFGALDVVLKSDCKRSGSRRLLNWPRLTQIS